MERLLERVHAGDAASVRAFWDSIAARGTPLLDPVPGDTMRVLAGFVYRSDTARNVVLENGVNGWAYIMNQLARVPGTDIWHETVSVPADIRLGYVFRENDDLLPFYLDTARARRWAHNRPDPFNPRVDSAQGKRSVLIGPRAAPDRWSRPRPGAPTGTIEDLQLESPAYGGPRKFSVYLPPGSAATGLPLLVFFDGGAYRAFVRLPTIMDNLLAAGLIRPAVVVFVYQVDRATELRPNPRFTTFIADELIPFVRRRYGLSTDPARTILGGSSLGGLSADAIALDRPDVVGGVISQSASLWWSPPGKPEPEYLARRAAREPRQPIRFYLEVGRFEVDRTAGGAPGQEAVSQHFRDVLVAKGYDVAYSTFPGGHEYQSWRVTLPNALIHFLGTGG